jgi:hypothetical protein
MFWLTIGDRMISTRDPQTMAERERRREVASILAQGLLRFVRASQAGDSATTDASAEDAQIPLDLPEKTRLSVAPRPAG